MSGLGDLRTAVADALAPLGLNTYTHLPGRAALPCAMVIAGSPYIEQGQTFGERLFRFGVLVASQTGENNSETSALDELIEAAVAALESDGWLVEQVAQPFLQEFNNAQALGTLITVSAFGTL